MSQTAQQPGGATPLPSSSAPHQAKRRRLSLFKMGAMAGALVLTMLLVFDKSGPLYAFITPPHTPDFEKAGETLSGQFGFSVASAGDINADGYGDVVVGADQQRKVFVHLGSEAGLGTTVYFSDTRAAVQSFGHSVSGGSDVSDDGIDDFVVGAPLSDTGVAYVYFGSAIGLPTRGATLTGELADDEFGWSVAIVGDLNHDDVDDVVIGAPEAGVSVTGRVYIYYGPVAGTPNPDLTLEGEAGGDGFGVSVAGAGDVNGDGIDDLVVGAWRNNDGGVEGGKAYVFPGSDSGIDPTGFAAVVGGPNDKLGTSVHSAGDVNGDGFADVIVGADTFEPGNPRPSYFAVYPGGQFGLITTTTLITRLGEIDDDRFGFAVTGGGDVDGDGFADFAVGAYEHDINPPANSDEGKAYGFVACTNGTITPSLLFSDTGEADFDYYGRSLAIVRDVNGDELDDLVVGAYGAGLPPTGKVYAYYGVAGGCRPQLALVKTVGLADYPAIYSNTSVITVPTDAVVRYSYTISNSGNVTLTQHTLVDNQFEAATEVDGTLPPEAEASISITATPGASVAPGVSVTNVATWTGSISITSPSGVTIPANRVLSAQSVASAQVNISGPTTDQDGDGAPDNDEGSGDGNGNDIPAYLDPDETPTPPDEAITGLSIAAPDQALRHQAVTFDANITAGTNVSYTWDFGDGQSMTGEIVTHTFNAPGRYEVTVTATNPLGELEAVKSIEILYGVFMPKVLNSPNAR